MCRLLVTFSCRTVKHRCLSIVQFGACLSRGSVDAFNVVLGQVACGAQGRVGRGSPPPPLDGHDDLDLVLVNEGVDASQSDDLGTRATTTKKRSLSAGLADVRSGVARARSRPCRRCCVVHGLGACPSAPFPREVVLVRNASRSVVKKGGRALSRSTNNCYCRETHLLSHRPRRGPGASGLGH
jgi:hypothetical protein